MLDEIISNYEKENNIENKNIDYIIYSLYKNNSHLFENIDFMNELINKDPKYIIYDKTNSPIIYSNYIQIVLKQYELKIDSLDAPDNIKKILLNSFKKEMMNLLNEIDNPRKPEDGKYKIPHIFLFEYIRNQVIKIIMDKKDFLNGWSSVSFKQYFENDCKVPYAYGKKLESLYLDNESQIYYAGFDSNDIDIIFKSGYRVNYAGALNRNFRNAHSITGGFMTLLSPGNEHGSRTIVVCVPKNETDILGSDGQVGRYDTDKINKNEDNYDIPTFLLPKYIIGCLEENNGEYHFISNPYQSHDMTQYAHTGATNNTVYVSMDEAMDEIGHSL